MMPASSPLSRRLTRNWTFLLFEGAMSVLFGVVALLLPQATLIALAYVFGAFAVANGILRLVVALRMGREAERWWIFAATGLFGVVAGLLALIVPWAAILALVAVTAAWAALLGVLEVVAAIQLRREIRGEWLLALSGVLSIALAAVLIATPLAGALALAWMLGVSAIVGGIVHGALALRVRRLQTTSGRTGAPDRSATLAAPGLT